MKILLTQCRNNKAEILFDIMTFPHVGEYLRSIIGFYEDDCRKQPLFIPYDVGVRWREGESYQYIVYRRQITKLARELIRKIWEEDRVFLSEGTVVEANLTKKELFMTLEE